MVKEPALVRVTVPHTPKTLAKFLGQIRQEVRRLEEEKQDEFFALHNARKELCTKNRGINNRYTTEMFDHQIKLLYKLL